MPCFRVNEHPFIMIAYPCYCGLCCGGRLGIGFRWLSNLISDRVGEAADVAQSMLVTAWNVAIASGGIVGGVLLGHIGVGAFSPALLVLLIVTFLAVWFAKESGFPASPE
ncbi:hypothetical protein SB6408_02333 [Klebsiella spallanzanii]|uniref:Uncharacterized protein n=1 Tax=Klebsiella spallanzanii TaxID=2587528 RepID=A0A564NIV4_9ENTR|nr:hypothetical protein SB6408_02333 [Klebsiella spallanzanii]